MTRIAGIHFSDMLQSLDEGVYSFKGLGSPALQESEHLLAVADHMIQGHHQFV